MNLDAVHRVIEPRVMYFGTPVVLISTTNPDGSANLAPMSSAWWVGHSCMLGLDASSQTTLNLQRTGELVLNLPDPSLVSAVDRLALYTGTPTVPPHKLTKGYQFLADKFGQAGLSPVSSDEVMPPRVAECKIALEAQVAKVHEFGDPDSGMLAIEASILRTHVYPGILLHGSDRHIDPQQWDPLIMKFTHFYGGGTNVGPSRLAQGWQIPSVPPTDAVRSRPSEWDPAPQ